MDNRFLLEEEMTILIKRLSKQSWFKIKADNQVIHIDPGYVGNFDPQGVPLSEFEEKADLILVTHCHKDHLQPDALEKMIKADTSLLAPQGCAEVIGDRMKVVTPENELEEKGWKIKVVQAYNTLEGHSTRKAHHRGDFVGYLITLSGQTLYHAGDTDFIPEMKALGAVDVAFLPIGGTYTMDISEAMQAVEAIKPKMVIGMHQLDEDLQKFKEAVEADSGVRAMVMNVGDELEI
jgi:L-ascorbate metabolism protein UlaG (beta-lactamase superfamily)